MRSSCPKLLPLLLCVTLVGVILPSTAAAGTFRITTVSALEWPLDQDHIRVLGESWARYDGAVDPGDTHWTINAHVRDDSQGGFLIGFGNPGVGVTAGKIIHCDPLSCGADKAVQRCPAGGGGGSYTVRGAVATFQPNAPEIHNLTGAPRFVLCLPIEPPEIPPEGDPIVLDLDRDGFHFTGPEDPVAFDIDADGVPELMSWTDPSHLDGFLVLDLDRNGRIDNGREMFGNHTWMVDGNLAAHGFLALADYDSFASGGTEDGAITADDLIFDQLRVWIDSDHDGSTDPGELLTLAEVGLRSVELGFREKVRTDRHGNHLVYKGLAWAGEPGDPSSRVRMTDVFFVLVDEPSALGR